MIYGLDADLIFLSLSTTKNIYLLREASQFNKNEKGFNIIHMEKFKDLIYDIFQNEKENIDQFCWKVLNKKKIIKDFILLYFFLGNDFIPHLPSINIYNKGSNFLVNYYLETLNTCKKYLYKEDNTINTDFFYKLLQKIKGNQNKNLCEIHNSNKNKIVPLYLRDYKRELYKIENLIFKTNDPVKFHLPGFRKRYYEHYKINNIEELVNEYIKSISWISQYYLNGIPDWSFYYKFDVAPLSEDLIQYFNPSLLNFKFKINKPLSPIEQLSCVLHPLSFYLLPPVLKNIYLQNTKLFPKKRLKLI